MLRPGETTAVEDIYLKRHIAVGIPSMYGSYREERFEAVGLTFRLESLATALFERVIDDEALRAARPRAAGATSRAGCASSSAPSAWTASAPRGSRTASRCSRRRLADPDTTLEQFLNVFQLISRNIETSIRSRILDAYEEPVDRALRQMLRRGVIAADRSEDEAVLRHSETFFRDLIAESFGLQRLDALVGRVLHALGEQVRAAAAGPPAAAPPDPTRTVLHPRRPARGRGAASSPSATRPSCSPVSSSWASGCPPGSSSPRTCARAPRRGAAVTGGTRRSQRASGTEVARIERATGARFGDPRRPLLLSVRGGAPAQHARHARDLPERRDQPDDRRGLAAKPARAVGRLGRLPALPPVLGHEPRARSATSSTS